MASFYAFAAAINAKLFVLAVIGIVSSVVSAFYYLRIVKVMYFDDATTAYADGDAGAKAVLGVSFAFNFLFVLFAGPLVGWAGIAAKSLF